EPVCGHEAGRAATQRRAPAHGRRAIRHSRASRSCPPEADCHTRSAVAAAGHRAVLRRGGAQASRTPIWREGVVRERSFSADDARLEAAGDRESRSRTWAEALRQAPWLAACPPK